MSVLSEYIEKLEKWDHKTFLNLYKSDFSRKTKTFAKIYSFFGSLYFWGLVWIIWFIYGYITKDYYLLVLFTGGFDQSIIIHILIRYKIIRRNRPFITLQKHGVTKHDDYIRIPYIMSDSEQKSFPSGHVTFLLFFGFIFAYFFNSWAILLIFIGLDIIMALSRVILGVHFPTDVLFGFFFGFLYALLYLGLTYIWWVDFYYWIGPIFSNFIHFWR
ncbi:MAG: phosphatase PAP2 family protein [Promethearchaeota archaeon]